VTAFAARKVSRTFFTPFLLKNNLKYNPGGGPPRADPVAPPHTDRPFTVRSFGLTDPGQVRPSNEDHFVIVELARTMSVHQRSVPQAKTQYSSRRGHLFVVADGMGGYQAGEEVSLFL
jgi:hypothetical protein